MKYYRRGECDKAIKSYKKVIRIKPDFAEAHFNLGLVYAEHKRYDTSIWHYEHTIAEFKEAIRRDPDYVEAHYELV